MPEVSKNWLTVIAARTPRWSIPVIAIVVIFLIFFFVSFAADCEQRTVGKGMLEADRTVGCGVGAKQTDRARKTHVTGQPGTDDSIDPEQSDSPPLPLEFRFSKSGREESRATNRLSLIGGESDLLGEMPDSTWGYFYDGSFSTVWRRGEIHDLTVRNRSPDLRFEVQKRSSGRIYIGGYMRGDIARSLAARPQASEAIKLYSKRYLPTDAFVTIPLERIVGVEMTEITLPRNHTIPVMVLTIN